MQLESTKDTYGQEPDCCSPEKMSHWLTVSVTDGGGGPYLVLRTQRWALDETELPAFLEMLLETLYRVKNKQATGASEHGAGIDSHQQSQISHCHNCTSKGF